MSSNRASRQAIDTFRDTLARLVSCVTTEPLIVFGQTWPLAVRFATPSIAPLSGGTGLGLSLLHSFNQDATGRVHSVAYLYSLSDANGIEFLAYHWAPRGTVTYPHAHVRPYATPIGVRPYSVPPVPLGIEKKHLPTGRVSLEALIRLLLEPSGFHLPPLRNNWESELDASESAFAREQTWGMRPP